MTSGFLIGFEWLALVGPLLWGEPHILPASGDGLCETTYPPIVGGDG